MQQTGVKVQQTGLERQRATEKAVVVIKRFYRSSIRGRPLAVIGAFLILGLIVTALSASIMAAHDPLSQKAADRLLPPSSVYIMGTDEYGRDVFSRLVFGSRISLLVGLVSVGICTAFGTTIGLVSGYFGGKVDLVLQRVVDSMMAFPTLILAMLITAMLGTAITNVMLAVGIALTPRFSRVVRGAVLSTKENQYVEAARCIGASGRRIMGSHILPNVTAPIIIIATAELGSAIIAEASLSFLGLGTPPPNPSWGGMLSGSSVSYLERAWWLALFPGLCITLAVLGFNLLGDTLRDVWDPRLRGTR